MIVDEHGGGRDYEFFPSGPLKAFLEQARANYESWDVLGELCGLHPRVLYRVRESDYVSVRIADIILTRIGNSSFYEFYDEEDIVPRREVFQAQRQKVDNSPDAQRRKARRVRAADYGRPHGWSTRWVLEYIGEFWSDKRLNEAFQRMGRERVVQHQRRVLEAAQKMEFDLTQEAAACWEDRSHWLLAARYQRRAAPRIWGRCMVKLGGKDDDTPMTDSEITNGAYDHDDLAREVILAANTFNVWRWAFYVLRSLELCGWKPVPVGARR